MQSLDKFRVRMTLSTAFPIHPMTHVNGEGLSTGPRCTVSQRGCNRFGKFMRVNGIVPSVVASHTRLFYLTSVGIKTFASH